MYNLKEFQSSDMDNITLFLEANTVQSTWHTATTIIGWLKDFAKRICITEDAIILQVDINGKTRTFAPLVKDTSKVKDIITAFDKNGDTNWDWIPNWQAPIFEELGYSVTALKDRWEYLYSSVSLRTLSGKKLHSKRNFINSFSAEYDFKPYTDADFDGVMALFDAWFHDAINRVDANIADIKKDFDWEKDVVTTALKNKELFNITANVLVVDNTIVGFVAGELMANGVGAIYFEKADIAYKGIYPLIDNLFCKAHFEQVELVNRQEDLGIAGLKKSKTSYCPIGFAEVYSAKKR